MSKNNKKVILVTGGAGFIGSHLCEELSKDKNNVIYSLDNYFTGSKDNHVEDVTYIEGETRNIASLITEKPDIIYHLGEYSRVLTSFEDVDLVWRLNVEGTFQVLEYCRKNNVRLIYAGSSTKFGDSIGGRDESPYAWSKANNTDLVNNYGNWFDLDYAIMYFYNVYGVREIRTGKYATVIGIFTHKSENGEKLSVVKPGTQRRAFTHIDDTVAGILKVGAHGNGDGYCIGGEETFSILEIAERFGGDIEMLPEKKGDRRASTIDISKMSELGWAPQTNVLKYIDTLKRNG